MCDNIKAFKFKLRQWKNLSKDSHTVHSPYLKPLDNIHHECHHEYCQYIVCFEKSWTNDFRISKLWKQNVCCLLYL